MSEEIDAKETDRIWTLRYVHMGTKMVILGAVYFSCFALLTLSIFPGIHTEASQNDSHHLTHNESVQFSRLDMIWNRTYG